LAAIKQLAGQTLWYGLSNVGARMLNFLLTPLLTYLLNDDKGMVQYGGMSLLYAWMAAANIIFTYGMETAYFRFSNEKGMDKPRLFQTSFGSIIVSTIFFTLCLVLLREPIQAYFEIDNHPEYITWCALIVGLDTLASIPFAKLRQESKPRKYAFIKIAGILINILAIIVLVVAIPNWASTHQHNAFAQWYLSKNRLGYILFANLLQSLFVFLVLFQEWKSFRPKIDLHLLKRLVTYSAPMIIIGLGGMINEVMDRQFLDKWLTFDNATNKTLIAIYSANYKLAIFITLFIQAFKMAAEPFFFSQAQDKNAPALYARVMKWFVLTVAVAFLITALYLDVWKIVIIRGENFRSGIGIVPILLLANIFLGIYYNLSIWYKLTDKMMIGLYITLIGTLVTVVGNYLFIPGWAMYAAAWSTFACYFVMMVLAYVLGQKYYPIPYPVKKISSYLIIMTLLYFIKVGVDQLTNTLSSTPQLSLRILTATILLGAYLWLIVKIEKSELQKMPVVGKYIK
jgi:O-antigen/teichoic acid export membrane protein